MTGPRLSIIPARACTDPALKPRDLQVLCVLGRHTDDLGWCSRSQVKMAAEMGCARSTVFEAIERLVKAGYLERHIQAQESGRDAPHIYRVILDPAHPNLAAVKGETDADSGPESGADTPADQPAPPAGISAPPAGPGPAPKNDPLRTEERGRAGASEGEETETANAETDDPRHFERRVKRLAEKHSWPGWANSSTAWTVKQFAALSAAERTEAEAAAAAYIGHVGRKALSLGTYFAERKWRELPEAVLNPPEATVIEAKPFGPVWGGIVFRTLLTERPEPGPTPSAFLAAQMARDDATRQAERMRRQAQHGWPKVLNWFRQAESRKGFAAPVDDRWLGRLMEAVPVGSAMWARWKEEHERRGWPWMPDPGGQPVVFFPRGGPDGIGEFEAALAAGQQAGSGKGNGDDGDRQEAAE